MRSTNLSIMPPTLPSSVVTCIGKVQTKLSLGAKKQRIQKKNQLKSMMTYVDFTLIVLCQLKKCLGLVIIGLLCKLILFSMLSLVRSVNNMEIAFMLLDVSLFPLSHIGHFSNGPSTWLVKFILIPQVDTSSLSQLPSISPNGQKLFHCLQLLANMLPCSY